MRREVSSAASGVYAALVTPRQQGGAEADLAKILDYIGRVESAGVAGLVLFGSTGEFVHFEVSERIRVATLALRRARKPILVNVSHSDLAGVAALAENAIGLGAAGILLMPPYFYRYDTAAVEAFYGSVIDLVGGQTRIYLYHLPQYTSPISADLAVRLLQRREIAGIKDSSGDWQMFKALHEAKTSCSFAHLAGHERIYGAARAGGADGTVSGVAAALPELIVAWDAAIVSGEERRSAVLGSRVAEYLDWLDRFPPTFLIRQTAAARGWVNPQPSLPLSTEASAELQRFRSWFPHWWAEVQQQVAADRDVR